MGAWRAQPDSSQPRRSASSRMPAIASWALATFQEALSACTHTRAVYGARSYRKIMYGARSYARLPCRKGLHAAGPATAIFRPRFAAHHTRWPPAPFTLRPITLLRLAPHIQHATLRNRGPNLCRRIPVIVTNDLHGEQCAGPCAGFEARLGVAAELVTFRRPEVCTRASCAPRRAHLPGTESCITAESSQPG